MKWYKKWYRDYGPPPWPYWREREYYRPHLTKYHEEDFRKEDYKEWLLEKKKHMEEKIREIEAELKELGEES